MTSPSPKPNIIVVDDTPANLHLLRDMLTEQGYDVRPAPRGEIALKAAENAPPDLILLDINMPDMNGYEVCQRLKEKTHLKDIPVIFISALTTTHDKVKAFSAGGIDYVTKPFQFEEVQSRVEIHLKLRRYQLELEQKNQQLQQTIDDLQATQKQLIQAEKMSSLGLLTAGIAHELNNPINFINLSAKGLKQILSQFSQLIALCDQLSSDDLKTAAAQLQQLKQEIEPTDLAHDLNELTTNIMTGAERCTAIIKGLQTFSRLDEAESKPADLHQNIDSALVLLQHHYKDLITIEKEYGALPKVTCSPGQLNQVFMNILANAIDAIKQKEHRAATETITIKTAQLEQVGQPFVTIAISDTGSGIAEAMQDHLFEPFFTTKEAGQGTGLGLSISYGIIKAHGGSIEVRSCPNEGTTFTLYLPVSNHNLALQN